MRGEEVAGNLMSYKQISLSSALPFGGTGTDNSASKCINCALCKFSGLMPSHKTMSRRDFFFACLWTNSLGGGKGVENGTARLDARIGPRVDRSSFCHNLMLLLGWKFISMLTRCTTWHRPIAIERNLNRSQPPLMKRGRNVAPQTC